jgi:hypothetical protein
MRRRQLDIYRAMGPQRRVEQALALSEEMRAVAVEGIKRRNPSFDDEEVRVELLRILHGTDLAEKLGAIRPTR